MIFIKANVSRTHNENDLKIAENGTSLHQAVLGALTSQLVIRNHEAINDIHRINTIVSIPWLCFGVLNVCHDY